MSWKTVNVVITHLPSLSNYDNLSALAFSPDTPERKVYDCGTRALLTAPGHRASVYGTRYKDEKISAFITTWDNKDALTKFEQSVEYHYYTALLALLGNNSDQRPNTQILEYEINLGQIFRLDGPRMGDYLSIRTIYLPLDLKPEQRKRVWTSPGLYDWTPPSKVHASRRPFKAPFPWKSWLLSASKEPLSFNGKLVEALSVIHFWRSWERRDFYMRRRRVEDKTDEFSNIDGELQVQSVNGLGEYDIWNLRLKSLGALGWEDELLRIRRVPINLEKIWVSDWNAEWEKRLENESLERKALLNTRVKAQETEREVSKKRAAIEVSEEDEGLITVGSSRITELPIREQKKRKN